MSEQRSQAWSEIKEALRLDSCSQDEEAFTKYLEGVQKLCCYIKDETTLQGLQENDSARINVMKVIATMKQSLSRVEEIISKPVVKCPPNPVQFIAPEIPHPSTPPNTQVKSFSDEQRLSPLEVARKQNLRLEKSFQNRLANVRSPSQRVTLSLELQRRMQENLVVARSKESQLRLEEAKRESEALQLAARKLSNCCMESQVSNNHQSWSNKVALCACVLHYRPDDNWTETFSKQFRENPSQTLVTAAVGKILRMSKHPLTCWLLGKQQNLKARLTSELTSEQSRKLLKTLDGDRDQLKEIAEQASSVLETFLQIFGVCMDLSQYTDYVDETYPVLEQIFFQDLWPTISQLYRHAYKEEEALLANACRRYKSGTDSDVNICDLLSLPAETLDTLFVDLYQFTVNCAPLAKVHSLVEITHVLCENDKSYERVLSADDLIGLVSCLLVQSNMPHLFAEFQALENFIPHRFLMGEEGYSLTTFLTAVKYLESQGQASQDNAVPDTNTKQSV